jgi:hypothetical protein
MKTRKNPMKTISFRISEANRQIIADLAAHYDTSQGDVLGTLVATQGKRILKQAIKAKAETN